MARASEALGKRELEQKAGMWKMERKGRNDDRLRVDLDFAVFAWLNKLEKWQWGDQISFKSSYFLFELQLHRRGVQETMRHPWNQFSLSRRMNYSTDRKYLFPFEDENLS